MVSTVQASERLEATGSSMDTMMIELHGMKVTSEVKFWKYWFPNNKFVHWNEKVQILRNIGTRSKEIDAAIKEGKELGDALVDIDVYAIGIPRNTNGSKIVITTNFKHLSFGDNLIDCVEIVEIGRLKPDRMEPVLQHRET
ncbi:hypothetical protein Tco_0596377 [Tanacetum coccineum]